jgi:hypothetical protein
MIEGMAPETVAPVFVIVSVASEAAAAWVEAGATVAAVIAAVWAGLYARRAYRKEVARDVERDEDRRREQAEKVSVWCERYDFRPPGEEVLLAFEGGQAVTRAGPPPPWPYHVRNASEAPVYDVVVEFVLDEEEPLGVVPLGLLPPADEPVDAEIPSDVRKRAVDLVQSRATGEFDVWGNVSASLRFRDASGRHFLRGSDGVLMRYELAGEAPRLIRR